MEQVVCEKTRVAVLGILVDLARQAVRSDLQYLERLVEKIEPDLLCAAIRRDHWEQGNRDALALEYREVLVPLAERTNIVIVPLCGASQPELTTQRRKTVWSWCVAVLLRLNAGLQLLEQRAGMPEAITTQAWGRLRNLAFELGARVGDGALQQWAAADQEILDNILQVVGRDPGRRVLVTVDCWRRHALQQRLRQVPEIELVEFWRL